MTGILDQFIQRGLAILSGRAKEQNMTMHAETQPVTLNGGPFDGLELDVTPQTQEVQRRSGNWIAVYVRTDNRTVFKFVGFQPTYGEH